VTDAPHFRTNSPAEGKTLDSRVVVRRHDEGDVIKIEPAFCCRFGKIVLLGMKVIGAARVHRWTPHKTHRPHTILLPLNSDFWEGELIGTREATDQIFMLNSQCSTPGRPGSLYRRCPPSRYDVNTRRRPLVTGRMVFRTRAGNLAMATMNDKSGAKYERH